MRSNRSVFLPLVLLVALMGCRGGAPAPTPAPQAGGRPLLPALDDPDPSVRRNAAETLGRVRNASRQVIDALLVAQWDEDDSVATAASAALDRIQPEPEVAVPVPRGTSFESVEEVLVRAAYTTWQAVDCEAASAEEGEQLVACWRLVRVPPVFQKRIKQATPLRMVWRSAGEVSTEDRERAEEVAAVRAAPPPPEVEPMHRVVPPEGEPEGAQPGEVWCRYGSAAGGMWRRRPECEEHAAAR